MIELAPGHVYRLKNLKDEGCSILTFYRDPDLHNGEGLRGPSTQEILRACIKRVEYLDSEKPWWGNKIIVTLLRKAIALFEARALLRKVDKGLAIEDIELGEDGHVKLD